MRYGGNTTCLLLAAAGQHIVIDGGTGIVALGERLIQERVRHIRVFLTHPHWDHVMGLPYFEPLYTPGYSVDIYGADSENKPLEAVVATQHRLGSFPVAFEGLQAQVRFHQVTPQSRFKVDSDLEVSAYQLNHPGIDLGYKFSSREGTFVVLTDLGPIEDNHLAAGMADSSNKAETQRYYQGLVDFVRSADLVYHDTNFTEQEIVGRRHWGHSTPDDALLLVGQHATPPRLILGHHDPDHSDDVMDAIYNNARTEGRRRGIDVLVAKEGETLEV
jgi:phosphoribosyl 1,2-cyclic phosphodiesterase